MAPGKLLWPPGMNHRNPVITQTPSLIALLEILHGPRLGLKHPVNAPVRAQLYPGRQA